MFRRLSALAVLGLAAVALPSNAQMGPPDLAFRREPGPPSPEMEKQMAEHRAQEARDMRLVLRLRPDQEAAWQAFQTALAPPPMSEPPAPPPAAATTPERLDAMGRRMAEMDARRARADGAIRTFYAALSPEQQQVFDALERLRGPRGPGRPMMFVHAPPMGAPPP